ncbi:hypothetical protein [Janthinobacterium sp.]|uniref:hypothetical protein n=1 Tax=Janthinobacterium sp. TaxID=1871054 RepID=UPI00293D2A42|nr:hypothetical protein [Janthinobacterium sp.]
MCDFSQVAPLLDQVAAGIGSVTASDAYNGTPIYGMISARAGDIAMIIPSYVIAVLSVAANHYPSQRDKHNITLIAAKGRLGWQKETGYGRRSVVETTIDRYKAIIGQSLRCLAWAVRGSSRRCGDSQPHAGRRAAKFYPRSKNGIQKLLEEVEH